MAAIKPAWLEQRAVRELRRVSTTEALVRHLTADILDGTLEPGRHVGEVAVSQGYGVSRHSVRAAMAELAHRGLLRRAPHRGYWVPVLTKADVVDLHRMRLIVESEAIRELSAARRRVAAAESVLDRMESMPPAAPWPQLVDADLDLHRALVAAVGSPRMLQTFDVITSDGWRLLLLSGAKRWSPAERDRQSPRLVAAQHRELLELIAAGSAQRAADHFREHLGLGLDELLADLPDGPAQPSDVPVHADLKP